MLPRRADPSRFVFHAAPGPLVRHAVLAAEVDYRGRPTEGTLGSQARRLSDEPSRR